MGISGGAKFFKRSKNLFADGTTATASTGEAAINRALDKNVFTFWRSVGSLDSITETIVISFPATVTIDRILLIDHNWKQFTVKFDSAGIFTDFTTVVGLDGSLGGGITETTFSDTSAYYEFTSVTTTRIEITITKTQVVDAQKFINQIVATEELGTLVGFPNFRRITPSRTLKIKKMLSGRSNISKSEDIFKNISIDFKNYPSSLAADINLMFTLDDSEDDFLVWPCGGRRGTDFFRFTLKGFRLEDLIPMQVDKDIANTYSKNVYINTVNLKVSLTEHV